MRIDIYIYVIIKYLKIAYSILSTSGSAIKFFKSLNWTIFYDLYGTEACSLIDVRKVPKGISFL